MNMEEESRVKFMLEDLFKSYPSGRVSQAILWVKRLSESKFTVAEVRKAVDYSVNNLDRCPSYAEFKNVVYSVNAKPDMIDEEEAKYLKRYHEEMNFYRDQRNEALKLMSEQDLKKFTARYIAKVWPKLSTKEFEKYGIGITFLERCAVKDLFEAKFIPEKAISIAQQKNNKILNFKNNYNKLPFSV